MIGRAIGKCAQCRSPVILTSDEQSRKWATCTQCGAQYPLEQGRLAVGEQPDKAGENSFTDIS